MANMIGYEPYDFLTDYVWFGNIITANNSIIIIDDGNRRAEYQGSFNYDPFGNVSGILRGYNEYRNDQLIYEINDLNANAADVYNSLQIRADAQQAATLIFQGDDRVEGSNGNDRVHTFSGNDMIFGMGGDDTLKGGAGNDLIDGGEDIDTAVYSGNQKSYTLTLSPTGTTITDRRLDGNGTDTLIDIENLQFTNSDFDIGIRSGANNLSTEDFAAIVELYIAYFDRAPASKGLLYWATRLDDGMTLPEIAESFFVQPETQRTYDAYLSDDGDVIDTGAFVKAVFNNLLGRDPSGPYWVNELDRPDTEITPAIFILAVLNGAKAVTGGASDAAYLDVKTDIGVYFSAIKGLSDYDDTVSVMNLYDGTAASVANAVAEIDQIYAEALDPNSGEFLMQLVGVIDDPFAVA